MKKFLIIFSTFFILLIGINSVQGAACDSCDTAANCDVAAEERCIGGDPTTPDVKEGVCQDPENVIFCPPIVHKTFGALVDAIINFIFTIAMVVAPLMVIIGAFFLLTAAGAADRIKLGKNIITYTLIGLAIVLLAKGLIAMIEQVMGVKIGG